jgi:hypothetical protein
MGDARHIQTVASSVSVISETEGVMRNKVGKNLFVGNLENRGGKKLGQPGTEFFHKKQEVRKHPTRGFRGRKG